MELHKLCLLIAFFTSVCYHETFNGQNGNQHIELQRYFYQDKLKIVKYFGTRISYHSNTTATFQLKLLVSGDVNPNPGPSRNDREVPLHERIVYDRSALLSLNHNQNGRLPNQLRERIIALGINKIRPIYRGKRSGRRKQRQISVISTSSTRSYAGQDGANVNNLRYLTNTYHTGQAEVSDIIPWCNEDCLSIGHIQVVHNNAYRPHRSKRILNRTNLLEIKTNEHVSDQVTSNRQTRVNLPTVYLCNARSLNNKLDEMEIIIREKKVAVAAITETWFRSDMPLHLVNITDYTLFTKSRQHRQGGGVALYVDEIQNPEQMPIEVPVELEVLWVKLRPERLPRAVSQLIIAVVYHPPDSVYADRLIDHLQDNIDRILGRHPDAGIAIMGDFNQLDLTSLLANANFKQIVKTPTRENRILDKIVTNFPDLYTQPFVSCPLGTSDHNTVLWSPLAHTHLRNATSKRITRPLRDSDMRRFGSWIASCEWSSVMDSDSSNDQAEAFYDILNSNIDQFLPTKTVKMHCRDKKWMTPVIKSLIKERQIAFSGHRGKTRYISNRIKREIRKAKHDYYHDRVSKHKKANPAEWYKEIKIMTNMKNVNSFINVPGVDRADYVGVANRINDFFKSVAADVPAMDPTNLPAYLPDPSPPPRIEPWDVYQQLKKVKVGKAVGPDMLPSRIIKEFAYELSTPLAHIYSTSLAEGVVPRLWKRAVVVPVPKSAPASIDKLRPISLTDYFAKVFEGFVAKWLMKDIGPLLDKKQFGNIKGSSTAHYLVDLLHCLYLHAEKSKAISTLVMTDFRKAFDRIDHTVAIEKMISYGVKPALIRWIADFLIDRSQCVRYKGITSEWTTLKAGVPQGTILGPIVFLTVIDDALRECDLPYWKYVDDLSVIDMRFEGDQSLLLETTLQRLSEWSLSNGMSLNPAKCETMQICFMRKPPESPLFEVDHQPLKQSESVKLLGVHIRNDLKWNDQVDSMIKRANGRIHLIRILKSHGLPTEDLRTIYIGFLRPLIEYATPVWNGGLTKQQIDRLERIQKRTLKIILGPIYRSYDNALDVMKLPSLVDRRKGLCMTFAEKLISNDKLSYLIPPCKNTRTLRRSNVREQLKCKTKRFRSSPIPYLIDLLNSK